MWPTLQTLQTRAGAGLPGRGDQAGLGVRPWPLPWRHHQPEDGRLPRGKRSLCTWRGRWWLESTLGKEKCYSIYIKNLHWNSIFILLLIKDLCMTENLNKLSCSEKYSDLWCCFWSTFSYLYFALKSLNLHKVTLNRYYKQLSVFCVTVQTVSLYVRNSNNIVTICNNNLKPERMQNKWLGVGNDKWHLHHYSQLHCVMSTWFTSRGW